MTTNKHTPTAIALKYDEASPPTIAAKGTDALAQQILEIAKAHNIPLHQDENLTALLSQLDLGEEIPNMLYVAVAEVIAFAYRLNGRYPKSQQARYYQIPGDDAGEVFDA